MVLLLRDSNVEISIPGRYILFSNIRHRDFVQIPFRPTFEEKLSIIGDEFTEEPAVLRTSVS